ncbi:MAG: glycerophosphodiester phosphodiesterase [Clostridia bacterium]|nr:glycerophosphodiester phosphodiesterase [Clostridia bacterium]
MELDIQLSKDKQVMVFHDYSLKRMCGVDKKLSDLTCRELKALSLSGTEFTIPTLSEVLELVDGRVPLLIELKSGEWATALCEAVAPILDKYRGAFGVESFDPRLMSWFKKYRRRYARGQIVTKTKRCKKLHYTFVSFCLSKLFFNVISRPDFIAVDIKRKKSLMIYVCKKLFHIPIFVWTVRAKEDIESCKAEGYNLIFEKNDPTQRR